ncbi:MAG TPA: VacB/RNase II family 3'-5' exoribonuclease [Spirochaetota bacterium]|nr:VacB/RNase II family 3'-5' exoribonuclease [Spirochaetota bacterium]
MPVSSKIIISNIEKLPELFTKADLHRVLQNKREEKKPGRKPGSQRKQATNLTSKDIAVIENTIHAMILAGFLIKEKAKFRKMSLVIEGTISVNQSRDTVIKYNDQEILVKRDDLASAQRGDSVSAKVFELRRGFFCAEILKVHKRKKEFHIARVTGKSGSIATLKLLDVPGEIESCANIKKINVNKNDYAVVALTGGYLSGKSESVIQEVFSEDNEDYDFIRIKNRHSLPDDQSYFNESEDDITVPESELKNRKDYTKLFTVTIDGETAKDFDDAISIKASGRGTKIYVHIADVSAYVKPGSRIDIEAYTRGTSFYLGNRVIPMLPEKLSNDLCSLREGVPRYTLTAEMNFDAKGKLVKFEAFRGIIKVNKRLTYTRADELISRKTLGQLPRTLQQMFRFAKMLNEKRTADGRLDLNLTDVEVIYEKSHVKEIKFATRLKSHMLIEEFMLSANEAVSRELKEKEVPSLYRVHEEMSPDNIESLKKFLTVLGLKIDRTLPIGRSVQEILYRVQGKPYEQVVNLVVLKSMMSAYYGIEPLGHFGLGFLDYTHFTSPIRRYPDLIVHRCLKSLIDKAAPVYKVAELIEIGEKSSAMERVAQKAERDMVKMKSCRIMKNRIGEVFDVVISGVSKYGMYVSIIEMPIEGMIPLRNISDDYYILQEDDFTIVGRKYNKRYRLGDKIKARLSLVDIDLLRIDFELYSGSGKK